MLIQELLQLHGMLRQQQQRRQQLCTLGGECQVVSCQELAYAVLRMLQAQQQQWQLSLLAAMCRAAAQMLLLLLLLLQQQRWAQCPAGTKGRKQQVMGQQQLLQQHHQLQLSLEVPKSAM
jgi:hypothetical protein